MTLCYVDCNLSVINEEGFCKSNCEVDCLCSVLGVGRLDCDAAEKVVENLDETCASVAGDISDSVKSDAVSAEDVCDFLVALSQCAENCVDIIRAYNAFNRAQETFNDCKNVVNDICDAVVCNEEYKVAENVEDCYKRCLTEIIFNKM